MSIELDSFFYYYNKEKNQKPLKPFNNKVVTLNTLNKLDSFTIGHTNILQKFQHIKVSKAKLLTLFSKLPSGNPTKLPTVNSKIQEIEQRNDSWLLDNGMDCPTFLVDV